MARCFRGLDFLIFAARGPLGRRTCLEGRLFLDADSQGDIGRATILRRCVAQVKDGGFEKTSELWLLSK